MERSGCNVAMIRPTEDFKVDIQTDTVDLSDLLSFSDKDARVLSTQKSGCAPIALALSLPYHQQ